MVETAWPCLAIGMRRLSCITHSSEICISNLSSILAYGPLPRTCVDVLSCVRDSIHSSLSSRTTLTIAISLCKIEVTTRNLAYCMYHMLSAFSSAWRSGFHTSQENNYSRVSLDKINQVIVSSSASIIYKAYFLLPGCDKTMHQIPTWCIPWTGLALIQKKKETKR